MNKTKQEDDGVQYGYRVYYYMILNQANKTSSYLILMAYNKPLELVYLPYVYNTYKT